MNNKVLSGFVLLGFALTSTCILTIDSSISLQVKESHGQSVLEAGSVALPGDRITIGGIYRVFKSELVIAAGTTRSSLKLGPGSRFRTNGIPSWGSLSWTYLRGEGRATVNNFTYVHHWSGTSSDKRTPLLVHKEGSIEWSVNTKRVRIVIGDDFAGHWILEDRSGLAGIRSSDRVLNVARSSVPSLQTPEDLSEYSWKPGSIMSPKKLRSWFRRRTDSRTPISSIKEIFGHWVRDRWGRPYLYVPLANGRFLFASSGPDEKFLTNDDRKWIERY